MVEAIDDEKESTDGKEMRVNSLYLLVTAKKDSFLFLFLVNKITDS